MPLAESLGRVLASDVVASMSYELPRSKPKVDEVSGRAGHFVDGLMTQESPEMLIRLHSSTKIFPLKPGPDYSGIAFDVPCS